jgi:nickel/cobalt transporter (NicO) family protein
MPADGAIAGSLLALGASGGPIPGPPAQLLLPSAVALGQLALRLALLVAFSLGLATVLTGMGVAAIYLKQLRPGGQAATGNRTFGRP